MNITILMITILTINARGLNKRWKRQHIYNLSEYDIICIQETHWDERCMIEVKKEWTGEIYSNNGDGKARGVAILVKKGAVGKVKMCENDGEGRLIAIKFKHMNEEIKLINIHAANTEKERRMMFEQMGVMCESNSLIVGDFNVWCGKLDVSGKMKFKNDSSRGALQKIKREKKLCDVWRERNPEAKVFSRKQVVKGELKQSRIDLVLSTKKLAETIGEIQYKITTLSDHMMLKFTLGQETKTRGGGVWCLNGELLKEKKYKEGVREYIKWEMNERMYEEDIGRWWEKLKEGIKEISKKYGRNKSKKGKEREKWLVREIEREEEKERGQKEEKRRGG